MKLSSTIAGAPKLLPTSTKVGSPPVVKPYISSRYETKNPEFIDIQNTLPTKKVTILIHNCNDEFMKKKSIRPSSAANLW